MRTAEANHELQLVAETKPREIILIRALGVFRSDVISKRLFLYRHWSPNRGSGGEHPSVFTPYDGWVLSSRRLDSGLGVAYAIEVAAIETTRREWRASYIRQYLLGGLSYFIKSTFSATKYPTAFTITVP